MDPSLNVTDPEHYLLYNIFLLRANKMSTERIRIRNSGLRMRVYGSEENFTDPEQCFKDE